MLISVKAFRASENFFEASEKVFARFKNFFAAFNSRLYGEAPKKEFDDAKVAGFLVPCKGAGSPWQVWPCGKVSLSLPHDHASNRGRGGGCLCAGPHGRPLFRGVSHEQAAAAPRHQPAPSGLTTRAPGRAFSELENVKNNAQAALLTFFHVFLFARKMEEEVLETDEKI